MPGYLLFWQHTPKALAQPLPLYHIANYPPCQNLSGINCIFRPRTAKLPRASCPHCKLQSRLVLPSRAASCKAALYFPSRAASCKASLCFPPLLQRRFALPSLTTRRLTLPPSTLAAWLPYDSHLYASCMAALRSPPSTLAAWLPYDSLPLRKLQSYQNLFPYRRFFVHPVLINWHKLPIYRINTWSNSAPVFLTRFQG